MFFDFLLLIIVAGAIIFLFFHLRTRGLHTNNHQQRETLEFAIQNLLNIQETPAFLISQTGNVEKINDAAERFFGITAQDFQGRPLASLLLKPYGPFSSETKTSFSNEVLNRMDEPIPVMIRIYPLGFSENASACAILTIPGAGGENHPSSDLATHAKNTAHDLNNLLTGITGNLALALDNPIENPDLKECILAAKQASVRAQNAVQKLMHAVIGERLNASDDDIANSGQMAFTHILAASDPITGLSRKSPRILVLDDEEAICELVSTVLNTLGYDVTEATTPEKAMHSFHHALQTGNKYDLVISDLRLPGSVSGKEVVNKLRQSDPDLKAIISSGYSNDPIMTDHLAHGFCRAIEKPYEIATLSRVVKEVLASPASSLPH